jgi:hypothetical protein
MTYFHLITLVHFSGCHLSALCAVALCSMAPCPLWPCAAAPQPPAPLRLLDPRGRRPKSGPCACASRERGAACALGGRRRATSAERPSHGPCVGCEMRRRGRSASTDPFSATSVGSGGEPLPALLPGASPWRGVNLVVELLILSWDRGTPRRLLEQVCFWPSQFIYFKDIFFSNKILSAYNIHIL